MFDKKTFVETLDRFEITNQYDMNREEITVIIEDCKRDEDPLTLAVFYGFQLGCMKAGGFCE